MYHTSLFSQYRVEKQSHRTMMFLETSGIVCRTLCHGRYCLGDQNSINLACRNLININIQGCPDLPACIDLTNDFITNMHVVVRTYKLNTNLISLTSTSHGQQCLIEMMERSSSTGVSESLELNNKVIMVTGASAGLGREFCLDLARAGCRIIAAARRIDRLRSLCDEINGSIGSSDGELGQGHRVRAVAVELDVTASGAAIEASVQKAWDVFGTIDALINNSGVRGTVHSTLNLSEKEWDHILRTNLTGTWLVSKYVCARMCDARKGGSIINISSIAGLGRVLLHGTLIYAASKVAVNTLTKVMAMEFGEYNIRVNSIAPGLFKSEITQSLMAKDWLKTVASKIVPLRTLGESDPALTSLVRYLIHDSSEYVSGNVFIVDAGTTLPGVPLFSSL